MLCILEEDGVRALMGGRPRSFFALVVAAVLRAAISEPQIQRKLRFCHHLLGLFWAFSSYSCTVKRKMKLVLCVVPRRWISSRPRDPAQE